MQKTISFKHYIYIVLTGLLVLITAKVSAQEQQKKLRDSTSTTFSFGELSLRDPYSIESKYEYDPTIHKYKFSQSLGEYSIRYPLYLTPREFQALVQKEQMRDYFREKVNAISGKGVDAEEKKKNLLPIFYVNSGFFETVFGGREIEIIPQGSVEVDLGLLYNKQDNPSFSPQNQSNFTFDFDQRISLSLQGNIGTRLSVQANYDTESTFDFQNQLKLAYNPTEDAIVQAIEVGNVSLPLNTSLIQGAQSLFGVKAQFQFGKTTITGVFSEQRSDTRSVSVQGGGTVNDFEIFALDYDENRHYFLSQYFRDTYDKSLEQYPFINSNIQITRAQVWITNRSNNTRGLTNTRSLVAIQDLGEFALANDEDKIGVLKRGELTRGQLFNVGASELPDNRNNKFDPDNIGNGGSLLNNRVRDIGLANDGFNGFTATEGFDFSKLENARLLNENEYELNTQLGYISLNQRLNNDEVLAVAYQYTKGGQVFQVGEFSNDGVTNTQIGQVAAPIVPGGAEEELAPTQALVVKMLKSTLINVAEPVWDLMMKNIYGLGTFRLSQEDFRLNILYTDPSPVNYIRDVINGEQLPKPPRDRDIGDTPTLLKVFNMDRLNINNDPVQGGDGFFDFFPGLTINTENGQIIFTTVEPFGEHLFNTLGELSSEDYLDPGTYNNNQREYVFDQLYSNTKIQAQTLQADKNKFQLKGRYKTTGQNGISIGAFNVPRGSVRVTAGGRLLQEGLDYTVNYQLGRVEILDPALLASNTPINISTENNAVFGQQTKRFSGITVEHEVSEDFVLGGTFLNLRERPLTQKSNLNFEPINNTIVGLNGNFSTEVPFLTRMVNKLPNIDTEAPSNFSFRGEFAYLFANAPKAADFNGEVTSYIDDFEGVQSRISVSSPLSWELSSTPVGFGADESGAESGYNRVGLSWYSIDPIFFNNRRPSGITDDDLSRPQTRRIFIDEVFPNTQIAAGQTQALNTLDLFYRPNERGPYNYNPAYKSSGASGAKPSNDEAFAGITRALTTTNFEQANIEFVEFWLLDPFTFDQTNTGGQIRINIGNISEDVLKDGRKQYENGLPDGAGNNTATLTSSYAGVVPQNQSLIYAFSTDGGARTQQDAGFDGLKDAQEAVLGPFENQIGSDASNDNYQYFLQASGFIEDRYRRYNGTDGDSPITVSEDNRGRTALPTVEDVNRDNTMNTIDQYFEYAIDILPGETTGTLNLTNPLITDIIETSVTAPNGSTVNARWCQFKIPLLDENIERPSVVGATGAESKVRKAVNGAVDLRSARFMRMYMTGFDKETLLRFATLDLVRGNYREFTQVPQNADGSDTGGLNVSKLGPTDNTKFSASSVSREDNPDYVIPPGVQREQLNNNNTIIAQDERALALLVSDLNGKDGRAVFNNFNIDMRQYENLELFIHAEDEEGKIELQPNDLSAIIRLGNDFTDNYYQVEVPLQVTPLGSTNPDQVWPQANRLKLPLSLLQKIKAKKKASGDITSLTFFDENAVEGANNGSFRVGIKGNPSFGNVRVLMLGVKNNTDVVRSGQVWFNEMRLSGLKNQGGWAATASIDTNIADFATISAAGRRSTVGFGGIEQGPSERSTDDIKQYDFVTSVNMGQLLPKKWGIKVPVSYSRAEELITPQFAPLDQDLLLDDVLDAAKTKADRDRIEEQSTDYTKRQSVSIIGLRKERTGDKTPMPYDVENFTFSSTYNQTDHRDFEIEESLDQSFNLTGTYDYAFPPLNIEPLKKVKFLQGKKYLKFLQDLNLNPLPSNINITSGLNRTFNKQVFRDVTLESEDNISLPALKQRNFLFDWQYSLNYNLTKSFNFNFTSSVNRIVRNYLDEENRVIDDIGIWDGLTNVGDPNLHNQSLQANYKLPINKIPVLDFINSDYSYTGDFQWQKGSDVFDNLVSDDGSIIPDQGNTIENSNTHRLNTTLDMKKFYKNIGFVKRTSNQKKKRKKKKKDSLVNPNQPKIAARTINSRTKKPSSKLKPSIKAYNTLVGVLSAVDRVSVNYQQNSGTILPGYTNGIGFLGTLKPSAAFTFGGQSDIRQEAARRGYLTLYDEFNQQYQQTQSNQLDIQATVGLLEGLKVDIIANRSKSDSYNENFIVDPGSLEYQSLTPNSFGNFSISTILIKTAFQKSDQNTSKAFEDFKKNRLIIANRLAGGANTPRGADGVYPDGYGRNSQAVLLPAFLAAYSGKDANSVKTGAFRSFPLPNWNLKYTGLMKIKWFKNRFKRFSLDHGYKSDYTINNFQSNLDFDITRSKENQERDLAGNFKNETLLGNIALTEQFSPLIKVDLETNSSIKVSAEIRKDRALSFSFDNSLLTEIQGAEYVFGLGYRIKDIKFRTRLGGKGRRRLLKSDLNLKADMSLRQNETVIRNLDVDNSQVTAGQDIYSLRFTADYALSKNLTALFFYDHSFSEFSVSTAFPQTNIRSGFTLRYNFGN